MAQDTRRRPFTLPTKPPLRRPSRRFRSASSM